MNLGKLDRNNLYPRPEMLDQATMKLSVQIPKSENQDNREPREITDIMNCYTQVVEAYKAMEEEPKPVTYWGSGTDHDPLCYKTRHCHIKSIKKLTRGLTYFDQFIYIHHNITMQDIKFMVKLRRNFARK